jgi:hypothetical protein
MPGGHAADWANAMRSRRGDRSTFLWLDALRDKELTAFRELANCFASPRRKLRIAPTLTAEVLVLDAVAV